MKELAKKEESQVTDIQLALLEIVQRKDIEPERLEKFLDLQTKMEDRQAERELSAALADFQSKCPIIKRTKLGHNSKKYAPFEDLVVQVQPLLLEAGLSYTFDVEPIDDKMNCMKVTIRHRLGGKFVSLYYFPKSDGSGNKNEAQGVRSANSYAKRTAFENALGIVTADEDVDGQTKLPEVTDTLLSDIKKLMKETDSDEAKFLQYVGAKSIDSMTPEQAKKALKALNAKKGVK